MASLVALSAVGTARGDLTFGMASPTGLHFDILPVDTLIAMKNDVARATRHDVGLFGNSRSVRVSKAAFGNGHCTFFNFSIPGTSFRSSVAMLEQWTADRAAPVTAIVSLDHFEIGMMGAPDYVPVHVGIAMAVSDAWALRAEPKNAARTAWRQVYAMWIKIKRLLSSKTLMSGLERLMGRVETRGEVYLSDGSRPGRDATAVPKEHKFKSAADGSVIDALLVRDMIRLAALRDSPSGPKRIIVYESPLAPLIAQRFAEKPTAAARQAREVARKTCEKLQLECRLGGAPAFGPLVEMPWTDATHAPGLALGKWINTLAGDGLNCKGAAP